MVVVPTEQWAQVVEKKGGPPVYKKVPVRMPGPDEVLVNIKYSGVCHTDLHAMNGDWPIAPKLPLIGGHEGAGVVVARGSLVKDIEIGDHAGVKWLNGSCLHCTYCQQADEPLCLTPDLSGYTVDGSFQQYCIAKAAHVARIPKECDLEEIAPVLCAGITTIAIDGGADKEKSCKELGASAFIDFTKSKDVVADVKAATPDGLGPQAVLCLAVSEKPFQQAAQYVRARGTLICIGLPADAYLKAQVFDTVLRMIRIQGSYVGNRQDTAEAIEFFRQGLIKAPYKTVGLSQLQEVYEKMEKGAIVGRYVLDTSK
eukprot:Nitzschia sp. Nitz4//scaffold217_size45653//8654//9789//NITZ4_007219-RA/size45653-augustus-gene-0.2-mRNA-1//1//CDS//3329542222//5466//frame0